MASLLTFRDGIKNFCSKYDRIVAPAIRFILALLMFWSIVHITGGHNETISSGLVIFLLLLYVHLFRKVLLMQLVELLHL